MTLDLSSLYPYLNRIVSLSLTESDCHNVRLPLQRGVAGRIRELVSQAGHCRW
jgi:hypothetical protein